MLTRGLIGLVLMLGMLTGAADAQDQIDLTPPRLSYADGKVSFWREGADDWSTAQVNTPLAPGDEMYTASPANLEIQIGPRAFVRAWANTQLGLVNQEQDFLQFKVTSGSAAFDLRSIDPGMTVEVATPNAALTIDQPGYYRVDVTGDRTSFITRRNGQATVTPASGEAVVITPSEEVVIEGGSGQRVTSYVAPALDVWDRWNYARSDAALDTMSARYVSPGTYGASDLDRYGTWRAVPDYGTVWIPTGVQPGWAPYTTGSWTLDPTYGWTWVDTAPWGWAPYHYGRWVSVNGFWGWAPGPVISRPVYAPALVAFLGGPGVSVGVNIGGPLLGWVALGWGEPIVPWWGRPGAARAPSWRGWGGPRVVNDVVVNNTTVVNVQNINVYRNTSVRNAVVVVNENRFGRGPVTGARIAQVNVRDLRPTHAAPQVTATPASFVPGTGRGARPPDASLKRSVVATRPSRVGQAPAGGGEAKAGPPGTPTPAPRIVSAPPRREPDAIPPRPPLGQSNVERRAPDRAQTPTPPRPPVAREAPPSRREPQVAAPVPATTPPPAIPVAVSPVPAPAAPPAPVTPPASPGRRPERPQAAVPTEGTPVIAPATRPPSPPRRPEPPQVVAPSETAPVATPPPARRPERPQAAVPTPPPPVAAPATPPPTAAPARRPEPPQAVAPPPTAPVATPPPARRPERPQAAVPTPPPVTAPATPPPAASPARRPETPQVVAPPSAAPIATPPPPARRPERPQAAAPTVPPAVAAPATTPPPARRPAAGVPPARQPLPGEPANQLSPNRSDKQ